MRVETGTGVDREGEEERGREGIWLGMKKRGGE